MHSCRNCGRWSLTPIASRSKKTARGTACRGPFTSSCRHSSSRRYSAGGGSKYWATNCVTGRARDL
eukprot:8846605-Pyramimonas_sp.AAC.1